jgi:hypothetical protein
MPSFTSFAVSRHAARSRDRSARRWAALRLLAGVVAGPAGWLLSLEAAYAASYVACGATQTASLHMAVLSPLAVVASGAALTWLSVRTQPNARPSRYVALARAALWLCAGFGALTLVTDLPALTMWPCF